MSGGEGYFTMARYIGRLQESCDSIDVQPMDIDTIADSDVFFLSEEQPILPNINGKQILD